MVRIKAKTSDSFMGYIRESFGSSARHAKQKCARHRTKTKKMADVHVLESTLVVPSEETPRGRLSLSNLEQVGSSHYTCTLYFYRKNEASDDINVEVMKAALAKTLVLFYPLAGRFGVGENGRKVVDCNAEGALFLVARSERSSDEINFEPSPELRSQFVAKPTSTPYMIMLQITYLKCGGVVLGIASNHILVDGRSAFHFLQTWARFARGDLASIVPPCFDYTLIRPRSPPKISFDYPEYGSSDKAVKNTGKPSSTVTIKLKLSKEQITSLKSQCNKGSNTTRVSTFCATTALFWKCFCIAQDFPPDTTTRVQFTADVRERLQPPLPEKFFGNTVIRTSATAEVSNVISDPIYNSAKRVKTAIDKLTDEHVRSFIDYVEVNQDKKLTPVLGLPKSDLRIATIAGMPVYEVDFGWGAPELMTWAQASGTNVICVVNEPGKDAGIVAFVLLDCDTIPKFEKAFYDELCLLSNES